MKRRAWRNVIVLGVLLALGGFLWLVHCGLLTRVVVTEQTTGPYHLLFRAVRGSYRQTGAVAREVTAAVTGAGIEPECGFGVFYDNPRTTRTADLRSDVGVVIKPVDVHRLGSLRRTYAYREFKQQPCLMAVFPFRGSASIYLGILKVYPALQAAAAARGAKMTSALELYRMGDTITYVLPLH